jgi:hypothetical protein
MNRQCPTILAKRCELFAAFHFFELILFAAPFGDLKSMCIFFQFLKHKYFCNSFLCICPLWWSSLSWKFMKQVLRLLQPMSVSRERVGSLDQ